MIFGAKKDDGSPGDYVCKVCATVCRLSWPQQCPKKSHSLPPPPQQDCGYVFTKGPKAWAALDDQKYACPPCGAPKFRFNKVPKGSASGKVEVKKSWF